MKFYSETNLAAALRDSMTHNSVDGQRNVPCVEAVTESNPFKCVRVCVCAYFLHQDVKMTGCEGLTRLRQRHKTIVLSGGPLKQMGP